MSAGDQEIREETDKSFLAFLKKTMEMNQHLPCGDVYEYMNCT